MSTTLLGRSHERGRIDAVVQAARGGVSEVLVLHGEVGIGKSTLLAEAIRNADDLLVLATRGYESESHLPFAGLSDLLRPVSSALDELPGVQREALAAALALAPAGETSQYTVCAATLSALAAVADTGPTLVVVDDLQWLDPSSSEALLFAARRLEAEGVAMLLAYRSEDDRLPGVAGLPELAVTGLSEAHARALVRDATDAHLSADQIEQLCSTARGNPLALTEIPVLLAAEPVATMPGRPLPVGTELERALQRRLDAVPAATLDALLVAAAGQSGDLDVVVRATSSLGLGVEDFSPAERAGIVQLDGDRVRFRHPMLRSIVYHRAPLSARVRAHAALAQVYAGRAGERDADLHAWHLSSSTVTTDAQVAERIAAAARRARRRGAFVEAAGGWERAAALDDDAGVQARYLEAAAKSWQVAGNMERCARLLLRALDQATDPLARARIQHLRGYVQMWRSAPPDAAELLRSEAARVADADPSRAALMLADAAVPPLMTGNLLDAVSAAEEAARVAEHADADAQGVASVVKAVATATIGRRVEACALLDASAAWLDAVSPLRHPQEQLLAVITELWIERYERARTLLDRILAATRAASALGVVPYALALSSALEHRTGNWSQAHAYAADSVRLAAETGQPNAYGYLFLGQIEGLLGHTEEARLHLEMTDKAADRFGIDCLVTYSRAARGLIALGDGRIEDAVTELEATAALADSQHLREPTVVQWAPDLAEAYARLGRPQEAEKIIESFAPVDAASGPWAAAAAARCRGMLDSDHAEDHFRTALALHETQPTPFERARTELCYGEWMRRNRRRSDARPHLSAAVRTFRDLGAVAWQERAESELRATGAPDTVSVRSGRTELTPQEFQVATAVAGGASNVAAAAALFLSRKTIEYHLSKVYRKLRISSRDELAAALTDAGSTPT
ncbi:MAG: AAA family ATPase [Egibacteraceae bacterium]